MSDDIGAYALEPRWVRRSFDRAAKTYDAAAVLHAEVRENLLERLRLVTAGAARGAGRRSRHRPRQPRAQAPIPQGTGAGARLLARRCCRWPASGNPGCGRSSASAPMRQLLPLRDGSIDLDREQSHAAMVRSGRGVRGVSPRLRAFGSALSFSAFGPDTLRELRSAWRQVDASHPRPSIHRHA